MKSYGLVLTAHNSRWEKGREKKLGTPQRVLPQFIHEKRPCAAKDAEPQLGKKLTQPPIKGFAESLPIGAGVMLASAGRCMFALCVLGRPVKRNETSHLWAVTLPTK